MGYQVSSSCVFYGFGIVTRVNSDTRDKHSARYRVLTRAAARSAGPRARNLRVCTKQSARVFQWMEFAGLCFLPMLAGGLAGHPRILIGGAESPGFGGKRAAREPGGWYAPLARRLLGQPRCSARGLERVLSYSGQVSPFPPTDADRWTQLLVVTQKDDRSAVPPERRCLRSFMECHGEAACSLGVDAPSPTRGTPARPATRDAVLREERF